MPLTIVGVNICILKAVGRILVLMFMIPLLSSSATLNVYLQSEAQDKIEDHGY